MIEGLLQASLDQVRGIQMEDDASTVGRVVSRSKAVPNPILQSEPAEPKKKGKKEPGKRRKASQYIVLRTTAETTTHPDGTPLEGFSKIEKVGEGNSMAECLKSIQGKRIIGKLLICCVRRRLTTNVQEVLKFN